MADDFGTPFEEPPKKNNTTLIIVIVVVLLLVCCCCVALGWAGWTYGDQLLTEFGFF